MNCRPGLALAAGLALFGAALVGVSVQPAGATETYPMPPSGSVTVLARGNGHGHGMSQYGAQGAALAGLSAAQILAFYYPGTSLGGLPGSTIFSVGISGAGSYTCVAAQPGLTASGVGALTTSGVTRYRLVPSGSGLALQKGTQNDCGGGSWSTVRTGLPSRVDFGNTGQGHVRLYLADGTSTDYRGATGAVRAGAGEVTVNRVNVDEYAEGVTPREMPASWSTQAVYAQAIAARTYGAQAHQNPVSAYYDICDTTQCQVYGGMTHYDASGSVLWTDDPAAVSGNFGRVLMYQGAPAFAQFSASNGGYTSSGGQPYLVGKADPYDDGASGDPYLSYDQSVPVASIASAYGLSSVSQIQITGRDGNGTWGGRVTAAIVTGLTSGGQLTSVPTDGGSLAAALGLGTTLFTLQTGVACGQTALVNTGFDQPAGLAGWAPSGVQLASYGSGATPSGSGRLLNGQATAALGSIAQVVTPTCGIAAGQRYAGSIWLMQKIGRPAAPMALYLWEYDASGRSVASVASQFTVPADGQWHNYSTALTAAAGRSLKFQLYFRRAGLNVTLDNAWLSGNQLVNASFDAQPVAPWQLAQVSASSLASTRGTGRMLRASATSDRGSLLQDVTPYANPVPKGTLESGQIWASVARGATPAGAALTLYGFDSGGRQLWSATSYLTVPADGAWHAYSVNGITTDATYRVRFQYYFWYAGQPVDLDAAALN